MVGTKLTILLALSISSLSAELITVNLSGVTTGGDYTVAQNSFSGLYSDLPGDYFGQTTVFGAGTAWTAQFTYDTALMPASILSDISGLNGSGPIPTHLLDSASIQWSTATFNIGAFTFTTAANSLDVPPVAGADQFTSVNLPLGYGNRVAYGDLSNFNAQGFHGYSGVQTMYSFNDNTVSPTNPSAISYSHIGALSFSVAKPNADGPLYTGSGIPTSFAFTAGTPGYGFAGFYNVYEHYTNVNGELLFTGSYLTGSGADLSITSAVTAGYTPTDTDPDPDPSAVPEPSTLALGVMGAALLGFRRLRRN